MGRRVERPARFFDDETDPTFVPHEPFEWAAEFGVPTDAELEAERQTLLWRTDPLTRAESRRLKKLNAWKVRKDATAAELARKRTRYLMAPDSERRRVLAQIEQGKQAEASALADILAEHRAKRAARKAAKKGKNR